MQFGSELLRKIVCAV